MAVKFTKQYELVVDYFTGTFEVAKELLLIPKHHRFAG